MRPPTGPPKAPVAAETSSRLFTAIMLDAPLQEALTKVIRSVSAVEVPVKWLPTGNLHMTLCFLGDVPMKRTAEVVEKLGKIRPVEAPFEMELGGLGGFPNLKKPSVLFAPVTQGKERLRDMAEVISKSLVGVGAKQEDREFNAHVTLGRVKGFKGAKTVGPLLEGKVPSLIGKMTVRSFTLVQSQLRPEGPIYTRLAEFPFKK
jgi:RNA 2',3'-cyclic 3'-phosphodiesterase